MATEEWVALLNEVESYIVGALQGKHKIKCTPILPQPPQGRRYRLDGWQPNTPYQNDIYLILYLSRNERNDTIDINGKLAFADVSERDMHHDGLMWSREKTVLMAKGLDDPPVRRAFVNAISELLFELGFSVNIMKQINLDKIAKELLEHINETYPGVFAPIPIDRYVCSAHFSGRSVENYGRGRTVANFAANDDTLRFAFVFFPSARRDMKAYSALQVDCFVHIYHPRDTGDAHVRVRAVVDNIAAEIPITKTSDIALVADLVKYVIKERIRERARQLGGHRGAQKREPQINYDALSEKSIASVLGDVLASAYASLWEIIVFFTTNTKVVCVGEVEGGVYQPPIAGAADTTYIQADIHTVLYIPSAAYQDALKRGIALPRLITKFYFAKDYKGARRLIKVTFDLYMGLHVEVLYQPYGGAHRGGEFDLQSENIVIDSDAGLRRATETVLTSFFNFFVKQDDELSRLLQILERLINERIAIAGSAF